MSGASGIADHPDRPGEYVLGVLRGAERRAFEADMARDRGLASEVAAWEQRLLPLALAIPPAAPPLSVWNGIQAAIASPAAPSAQVSRSSGFGLWRSLVFWRGFSLIAVAAAIMLAALFPNARPPAPNLVALLQAAPQAGPAPPAASLTAFTLALRPNGALSVAPVSTRSPPQGRIWQLWAIAPNAKPVPIGLLRTHHTTLFKPGQVPQNLRKPDILIAVSVEPPGGSPTGQPTGPVVFTGPLLTLQ